MTSKIAPTENAQVVAIEIEDLPYRLEVIPNVLASTLSESYEGNPDDTATLYLMSFKHGGEEYGTTIAAPEVDMEVDLEYQGKLISALTSNYTEVTKNADI